MPATIIGSRTQTWNVYHVDFLDDGPELGGHVCAVKTTGKEKFCSTAVAQAVMAKRPRLKDFGIIGESRASLFFMGRSDTVDVDLWQNRENTYSTFHLTDEEIQRQRSLFAKLLEKEKRYWHRKEAALNQEGA